VDRLSSFCGFSNATNTEFDRRYILRNILDESHQDEIDEMLDREKVPRLVTDGQLAEEEERRQREQRIAFATLTSDKVQANFGQSGIVAGGPGVGVNTAVVMPIENLLVFCTGDLNPLSGVAADGCQTPDESRPPSYTSSKSNSIPNMGNTRLSIFGGHRIRLGCSDERTIWKGESHVSC
jgi:hypothetical protein